MRVKQVVVFFSFLVILVSGIFDVSAKVKFERAEKEYVEDITAVGTHRYEVKMSGTLDEFNTADYPETYGDNNRLESKFQPNKYVIIENTGDVDVVNPRIVINGRRNWYSADDILASVLKPGMTDAEKAFAIWGLASSIEVQCHDNNRRVGPLVPDEKSNPSRNTYQERGNPVKAANFYYCSGCQVSATNFVVLCRHAGLIARAVWMCPLDRYTVHCVGEVWYDSGWHLFDPERRSFYLERDNTTVASYESLHNNPSLASRTHDGGFASPGKQSHAREYERFYPPSVMPVEQWLSTMDMTLRPGEQFIWRWDHVHKFRHGKNFRGRERNLIPYQLANGKIIYRARLDMPVFYRSIVAEHNIESVKTESEDAKLQPIAAKAFSYVIYKVSSPYPIVGGRMTIRCFRKTLEDICRVYISVLDSDWKEVWRAEDLIWYGRQTGRVRRGVILDEFIDAWPSTPIYDYYMKYELQSQERPEDTSISEIYIETDVQMAATALPSLSVGANKVVYRDESGQGRSVRITHGWTESSETTVPSAPAKPIIPSNGSEVDLASLDKLVWKAARDSDGDTISDYHVQVSPRPDMLHAVSPNFDRITFCEKPEWELPSSWLIQGRDYYWRVRARDKWGAWSGWSEVWSFSVVNNTTKCAKKNTK